MDTADAFRTAMAAHRVDEAEALLHPDVRFSSPVVHREHHGRDEVMPVLRAVANVFEDFRYDATFTSDDGQVILCFAGRVGDRTFQGIDQLAFADDGTISALTVYLRPLSALVALRDAMATELARAPKESS